MGKCEWGAMTILLPFHSNRLTQNHSKACPPTQKINILRVSILLETFTAFVMCSFCSFFAR